MSHCKKSSVRNTAIGKGWICLDAERSTLQDCGPSLRASAMDMECGEVGFLWAG